jgi:hypothetical protein
VVEGATVLVLAAGAAIYKVINEIHIEVYIILLISFLQYCLEPSWSVACGSVALSILRLSEKPMNRASPM